MPIDVIEVVPTIGEIVAWGDNSLAQISGVPAGEKFKSLARGGAGYSLAIRADGSLCVWGGTKMGTPVPAIPTPGGIHPTLTPVRFTEAAISLTHWVGLRDDGSIVSDGKFLSGAEVDTPTGTGFKAIAAGANHGVAIDPAGGLITWGEILAFPAGTYTQVRARSGYVIALRSDGDLVGWGPNLAWGTNVFDRWGWTAEGGGHYSIKGPFRDLAAGVVQKSATGNFPHVLALHLNGTVQGWGENTFGEAPPTPTGKDIETIAAGLGFSLGLDAHGQIHYWGAPVRRPTGVQEFKGESATLEPATVPEFQGDRISTRPTTVLEFEGGSTSLQYPPSGPFIAISAGAHHALALRVMPSLTLGPDAREPRPARTLGG